MTVASLYRNGHENEISLTRFLKVVHQTDEILVGKLEGNRDRKLLRDGSVKTFELRVVLKGVRIVRLR